MRTLFLFAFCLILLNALKTQDTFSEIVDLYDHSSDIVWDLEFAQGRIFSGMGNICPDISLECGVIAELSMLGDTLWTRRIPELDPGGRAISINNNSLFIAGHNPPLYSKFILHESALNGDSVASFEYVLPSNFYSLRTGGVISYYDRTIIFGGCKNELSNTNPALVLWINNFGVLDSLMVFNNGNISNAISQVTIDHDVDVFLISYFPTYPEVQNINHGKGGNSYSY